MLVLFTRDLGLVKVKAQSLREMRSKMRYHTQELSAPEVCLIKGREFWRLVGINRENSFGTLLRQGETTKTVARTFALLSRLIPGEEEPNQELFDDVAEALGFLATRLDLVNNQTRAAFETALSLRILHHLGYLDPVSRWEHIVGEASWSDEMLAPLSEDLSGARKAIELALHDSHL